LSAIQQCSTFPQVSGSRSKINFDICICDLPINLMNDTPKNLPQFVPSAFDVVQFGLRAFVRIHSLI
jgi:hypothetical protein